KVLLQTPLLAHHLQPLRCVVVTLLYNTILNGGRSCNLRRYKSRCSHCFQFPISRYSQNTQKRF
ncbi:hypothetical protein RYX36_031118, partial [Vicia faba]